MKKTSHKKVNLTSSNLSEEKLAELRRILPDAFSEEKIDWDKLRAVLGDDVDAGVEKFGFTWAGKSNAIKNVLIPSKATLTPVPSESVKFDESENLFIEGDNLEVLKLLQKAYFEKVKMIYIDPPYNTGGDFVYKDNFASPVKNYLEQTGQIDSEGNKLSTNKETNGRYHSDWLSMMYPRLKLAWNLLRDDGVIFVSIDDNEVHHLRVLMNEIFGEDNLDSFIWKKSGDDRYGKMKNTETFRKDHEYILVGYKNTKKLNKLIEKPNFQNEYDNPDNDPRGAYKAGSISRREDASNPNHSNYYSVTSPSGKVFTRQFDIEREAFEKLNKDKRIYWGKNNDAVPSIKIFIDEEREITPYSVLGNQGSTYSGKIELRDIFGITENKDVFDNPKPSSLVETLVQLGTTVEENSLILDFFAGSGTTAHAVMSQNAKDNGNRKWICVQLPEKTEESTEAYKMGYRKITDICKDRIKKVLKGYGEKPAPLNDGFKVFKLAESNYAENTFEFDPEKSESENQKVFEEYLDRAKQNKLIDDVDETSVIYENIVKEGFSLNSNIAEGVKGDNKIYTITDGDKQFSICLDRDIKDSTVKNLMEWAKGTTFICFDNALGDSAKANLGLNLELKTI